MRNKKGIQIQSDPNTGQLPPPPPQKITGPGVKNVGPKPKKLFLGKVSITIWNGMTKPLSELVELSGLSPEEIKEIVEENKFFENIG